MLLAASTCILAASALDRAGRGRVPSGHYDAIVVPGCRVDSQGKPSPALARRVRAASQLWEAGWAPTLVLTGGLGTAPVSEAAAAATYARSLGVPEHALVREQRSTSTEENARFSAQLLHAHRVLVVTDSYHCLRAERVFARYFDDATAVGSVPSPSVRIRGSLREVFALIGYASRGQL
jgi:uncharacterized SAM-binding protein YcdF (DUF218 family)